MIREMGQFFWLHMAAVYVGFLLDQCIGDPRWLMHPVCLLGKEIAFLEKHFNRGEHRRRKGTFMAVCVLLSSVAVPGACLWLCFRIHPAFGFVVESFWCGQLLACKDLRKESMAVYEALEKEDLAFARERVSRIVGRDTGGLSRDGVIRAAVETVAENTSDGVTAPFFYMLLFGCLGGFFYKAANTMDSMVGYKNERYLEFGHTAARLDDFLNFLPARIAALTMLVAAMCCHMDYRNGFRIFKRDRWNHASPNSAQTEAVCAGVLGVRLAGPASYFGKTVEKPYIGEDGRAVEKEDIVRANRLLYGTAWLDVAAGFLLQAGLLGLLVLAE